MADISADDFRRGQKVLASACAQVDDGCHAVILTAAQLRDVRRSFLYLSRQRDELREQVAEQTDYITLLESEPGPGAWVTVMVVEGLS